MKDNCLDTGTLQAFLDGELDHGEAVRISGHVADCGSCALLLAQAEEECAVVFSVLEREMDTMVPTHRLWTKINESIETERDSRPVWNRLWAFVSVALANPSMIAAASVVIILGVFASIWINREAAPLEVATRPSVVATSPSTPSTLVNAPIESEPERPASDRVAAIAQPRGYTVERAVLRTPARQSSAVYRSQPSVPLEAYQPVEDGYVKTISSLTRTVELKKDDVLRPAQRVSYERDMALVDDTISKMKKEVRRNPRNESARQVLYSSYQNKIDLLNSVAQKEELMASIR